jgi:hypothetical protein
MAFATAADVEKKLKPRLGRAFTADETAAAALLLDGASAVIEVAIDKTEADLGADKPTVLRFIAIEVVARAMANPSGLASEQEGLGAYSHAERYLTEGGGLWLTELEERMARSAVHGQLSGTALTESILSDECVLCGLVPRLCGGIWECGCDAS